MNKQQLILVNSADKVVGYEEKVKAHLGEGKLHRAFSVWIFNQKGEALIQKRSHLKMLWPLYWSNSCCSHSVKGEPIKKRAEKRLKEELGFSCSLKFVGKFEYQAPFKKVGSEHELCHVFQGTYHGPVKANPEEAVALRWLSLKELAQEVKQKPEEFTPWFKLELKKFLSSRSG